MLFFIPWGPGVEGPRDPRGFHQGLPEGSHEIPQGAPRGFSTGTPRGSQGASRPMGPLEVLFSNCLATFHGLIYLQISAYVYIYIYMYIHIVTYIHRCMLI